MAIQHYDGELGEFKYDDTIFVIKQRKTSWGSIYETLSYIGGETDGSKIEIPQGIINCSEMFIDSALVTPPVIPNGVHNCCAMFRRCHDLVSLPLIPESVFQTIEMFRDCTSLTFVPEIFDKYSHRGVDAGCMFRGCKNLETVSSIPIRVINRTLMFDGCDKLRTHHQTNNSVMRHYNGVLGEFDYNSEDFQLVYFQNVFDAALTEGYLQVYESADMCENDDLLECLHYIGSDTDGSKVIIPKGITNCSYMFMCSSLISPPVIPDGVVDCTAMFSASFVLQSASVIPDSVKTCSNMFAYCVNLTAPSMIPTTVEYCDEMYSWCWRLSNVPEVPDGVCRCNMFAFCEQLSNYEELCKLDSEDMCPYHAANNNKERN